MERYSHVMHLVSEVRGAQRRASVGEVVRAIFPGGTITGAPKESVMTEIARLEPVPRGAYTGSLGYVSGRRQPTSTSSSAASRVAGGTGYISAGGGIVIGSDPRRRVPGDAAQGRGPAARAGQGRARQRAGAAGARLRLAAAAAARGAARPASLFLECHDSFSYNIVDYLRMLGAEVAVVDHRERRGRVAAQAPQRHPSVLGPGPGDPAHVRPPLDWVGAALARGLPFLGVCLGHQALGVHLGARLERAPRPVHGEAHAVHHTGARTVRRPRQPGRSSRATTRSASPTCPPSWPSDAWTDDGVVMAVSHASLPAWGVQFHPESMLSEAGLELLDAFLAQRS